MLPDIENLAINYRDPFKVWFIQIRKFQRDEDLLSGTWDYGIFQIHEVGLAIKTLKLIRDGLIKEINASDPENGGFTKLKTLNNLQYEFYEFNGANIVNVKLSLINILSQNHHNNGHNRIQKMINYLFD